MFSAKIRFKFFSASHQPIQVGWPEGGGQVPTFDRLIAKNFEWKYVIFFGLQVRKLNFARMTASFGHTEYFFYQNFQVSMLLGS